jgi:hypothetical protein
MNLKIQCNFILYASQAKKIFIRSLTSEKLKPEWHSFLIQKRC